MSTAERQANSTNIAKLIAHPIRARALSILAEKTASPIEIYREIGHEIDGDLSAVSYHVGKLVEAGVVELVDERTVRGAVEHFYRAITLTVVDEEEWAQLSHVERGSYTELALQLSFADAVRALETGTLDKRLDRWVTRTPLLLDECGWGELCDLHADLYERTLEIKAASANRLAALPGAEPIVTKQIALFFEEPSL